MSPSSFAEAKALDSFLQTKRFRHKQTRRIYAYVLRNFQGFVRQHSSRALPSVLVVQRWLKERRSKWPLHMVVHRAWLLERFLEWSQAKGLIPTNPFAQLHQRYGPRTTPIVHALLSEDVKSALRALRPLPRFGSFLGKVMEQHVTQMRALGYRYRGNEATLLRLDRFLQRHEELTGAPLDKVIDAWSKTQCCPQQLSEAQKAGRLISKALHRLDSSVAVLSVDGDTRQRACQQQRKPHLYSDEEIHTLLQAALSYPSPRAPLRALSLYTMLMLAYCAGLRVSEITALAVGDVSVQDGTIEIRETKFFKSRRLPLAQGVMAALKHYLGARQQAGAPLNPQSGLFWNQQRGQGLHMRGRENPVSGCIAPGGP